MPSDPRTAGTESPGPHSGPAFPPTAQLIKVPPSQPGSIPQPGSSYQRRRSASGTPEEPPSKRQNLIPGNPSDPCGPAEHPRSLPTSQLYGTGSQAPDPAPACPTFWPQVTESHAPRPDSNVPPPTASVPPRSAPQPILSSSIPRAVLSCLHTGTSPNPPDYQYLAEDISCMMRKCAVISIHSVDRLIAMTQNINSTIKFKLWLGCYQTTWIEGMFRIVVSEEKAKEFCPAQQRMSVPNGCFSAVTNFAAAEFEKSPSEVTKLFAKLDSIISFHLRGYGGVSPLSDGYEIQWRKDQSLDELKKSASFRCFSMFKFLYMDSKGWKNKDALDPEAVVQN